MFIPSTVLLLHLPVSNRIKHKAVCICYNAITGSAPSYLAELHPFTVLPALSALRHTHACSNSNASTAKPMAFALSRISAPTSGTISLKTSGCFLFLQKQTQDNFLIRIFQLSKIVLHPYQFVQCVCVCVGGGGGCVRACMRVCVCVCVCLCVSE